MTTYAGFEVLDGILTPDRGDALKQTSTASLSIVASTVGPRRVRDRRGYPVLSRALTLVANGVEQVLALRAFIKARRGRVVPFWLPTYQHDLVLALPALAGALALTIQSTGYAAVYSAGPGRRHIVLGKQYVRVLGVESNGNGTDTVYLASQVSEPLAAGTGISCLTLCRLGSDEVSLSFDHPTVATASFEAVELPKETPQ